MEKSESSSSSGKIKVLSTFLSSWKTISSSIILNNCIFIVLLNLFSTQVKTKYPLNLSSAKSKDVWLTSHPLIIFMTFPLLITEDEVIVKGKIYASLLVSTK